MLTIVSQKISSGLNLNLDLFFENVEIIQYLMTLFFEFRKPSAKRSINQ